MSVVVPKLRIKFKCEWNIYCTIKDDMKLIWIIFFLFIGVISMNVAHGTESETKSLIPKFSLEKNGRDFTSFNIHPNSEEWLITECSNELVEKGDCYVLRYNLATKQLQRYALPDGYLYSYARFSPQGHYIVMNRIPGHDGSEEKMSQSFENSEVVIMRPDGSNFRVLPIAKGNKLGPFMSTDETKIAYWRSGHFRPGNKQLMNSNFDLWEYDLKAKHESLFAGQYQFLSGGNAQYISENEILVGTYAPSKYVNSLSEYLKRFNGSEIYKLHRGAVDFPIPSYVNFKNATNPSVDRRGNVYLEGESPSLGSSFLRVSPSGEVDYWQIPGSIAGSGIRQVLATPNGLHVVFIYVAEGTHFGDRKSAFGQLDISNSNWVQVTIPSLKTSALLPVSLTTE